jgi:hypothetical protein
MIFPQMEKHPTIPLFQRKAKLLGIIKLINWDGIRCFIKGDPSIRDIMTALKRQKEIDQSQ